MNNYSNLALSKSKGRIFKEANSLYRTPFQRDRDRIIHSASFRRLKHKTQVFVNTEGDHFRTRITHSIEVAQIARSIAKHLGLNDDLAETLSLAHDLGHTPFGHAGEDALNECMVNFGGFDHNLQTLRIIMFLEHKYLKFKGLNLTLETLDGLLKHNGPIHDLSTVNRLIGLKSFKNKINFTNSGSLEAQISAISDDIAYNNHDIQDGIRAKMFNLNDLIEINFFKDIYKSHKKNIKNNNKDILIYQIIRDSIDLMVRDLIKNTKNNLKTNKIEEMKIDGLFIAIGHDPATALFKEQLDMDKEGYLITKPDSTETNIPGVYAAGDVKDKTFRQAVTAAGMGCMAALEAEKHLSS